MATIIPFWTCVTLLVHVFVSFDIVKANWASHSRNNPDILMRYLRAHAKATREAKCTGDMMSCIPGNSPCCVGAICRNKFGHVCLYPLENCYCIELADYY